MDGSMLRSLGRFGGVHCAAIAFTIASFRNPQVKRHEVPRSPTKPRKWRKTVARSSPPTKTSLYKGNCCYRLYYCELSNFPLEAPRSPAKR